MDKLTYLVDRYANDKLTHSQYGSFQRLLNGIDKPKAVTA
jgi:hypothetical protein